MKRISILLVILFLAGCATIDKSGPKVTTKGSGINDSHIVEATTLVINDGVVELR